MKFQYDVFHSKLRKRTNGVVIMSAFKSALFLWGCLTGIFYGLMAQAFFFPGTIFFQLNGAIIFTLFLFIPPAISGLIFLGKHLRFKDLAHHLENFYPGLGGRLVTAFELSQGGRDFRRDPYHQAMANSLIFQMEKVLDRFHFGKAKHPRQIIFPLILLALFLFSGAVHAVIQPEFFRAAYARLSTPKMVQFHVPNLDALNLIPNLEVSPGDCEIPKGDNLMIEVRTPDYQPERVQLYVKNEGESRWMVFPMSPHEMGCHQTLLTQVVHPAAYYVKVDGTDSRSYHIKLIDVLRLEKVIIKTEYPVYMKMPPQMSQGWRKKMTVPRGTKFSFELEFNQPMNFASLVTDGQKRVGFRQDTDPRILRTELVAERDMVLQLDAQSRHQEPLLDLPALWIQTLPDLPPYAEVLDPMLQNYVFPTQEIPFVISVNDDYGIQSVTLVIEHRGKETRLEWMPSGSTPQEILLNPVLELENFRLHSRDLVFAYIEVRDTDPSPEKKPVRSALFTFLIRDYSEQFRMNSPPPSEPSLRILFEGVLMDQEKVIQDTWDYLSMTPGERPRGWEQEPQMKEDSK